MTSRVDNKNTTGIGSSAMDHPQMQMQPHYVGDLSKTSRTLGADEVDHQFYKMGNTVIRRAPRVHKRNKVKQIPYYEKKHKLGQRVSF